MDMMNGFELYFNIINLACGVYCLYTALKLRKVGKLFPNQLLIPKDSTPDDCLDEEGCVEYVSPRLLVFGIILTLIGVVCLADSTLHLGASLFPQIENLSFYLVEGGIILALVSWVWYMSCWLKCRKLYWV